MATKTFRNASKAVINIDGQVIAPNGTVTLDDERAAELGKNLGFASLQMDGHLVEQKAATKAAEKTDDSKTDDGKKK